uniref:Uncharacterized protein n=1 Tax=Arundo donax TaxID=35708 RepID=A0A0A9FK98_ARUDO
MRPGSISADPTCAPR